MGVTWLARCQDMQTASSQFCPLTSSAEQDKTSSFFVVDDNSTLSKETGNHNP